MTVDIAFVTDRTYLPWCSTALLSCFESNPSKSIRVHVLHDGSVTDDDADRLTSMAELGRVSVQRVDPQGVSQLPALDRFGRIVWYRFLLPQLLPAVDRVLYLDADTLVVDDLESLDQFNLDGFAVGAVPNITLPADQPRVRALGLGAESDFLNTGVLLLDLSQLREEGLVDKMTKAVDALSGRIRWPDQDALNYVLAGSWARLHPRYNVQNSFIECPAESVEILGADRLDEALSMPAILHFEGPYVCKPWHVLSRHPWRERYRSTLRRTPWADVGMEDDTVVTRTIGRLPDPWRLAVYEQVVRTRRGDGPSARALLARLRSARARGR